MNWSNAIDTLVALEASMNTLAGTQGVFASLGTAEGTIVLMAGVGTQLGDVRKVADHLAEHGWHVLAMNGPDEIHLRHGDAPHSVRPPRMKWLTTRSGGWASGCGRFRITRHTTPSGYRGFLLSDRQTGKQHVCRSLDSAKTAARRLALSEDAK